MASELALLENPSDYLILGDPMVREELQINLEAAGELDEGSLVKIKTPAGGITKWTIPEVTGDEVSDEVEGILVYVRQNGVLWPADEIGGNARPVLTTNDLRTAYLTAPIDKVDFGDLDRGAIEACALEDGGFDWKALPYNQWGTGKRGHGKRCKESRVLYILRAGCTWPSIIQAQPGSLGGMKTFLAGLKSSYFRTVVKLSLSKETSKGGQEYSRIGFRVGGYLTPEQGKVIFETYTKQLRSADTATRYDIAPAEEAVATGEPAF